MADLSFVQVAADATGKRLRTTLVEDAASTMHQEIMVVAGGTGVIWEPFLDLTASSSANAMPIRVVTSASSVSFGYHLTSTGLGAAAIDPRQATIVGGTSGAGIGTIVSTAAGSAAIDPRQSTIVAATSGAGLGTIISTGVGGAAIDPRVTSGAGSSGVTGTTLISTALAGAAIDPRQATIVGGTSGAGIGTIISTAVGAAAIDPRQVTLQASAAIVGIVSAIAGDSTHFGAVYGISTSTGGAIIDPRIIAAQATSVVLGTVAVQQSTAYVSVERDFADSTANYNQKYFYTTGIVAAAAATMQSLNQVTNLTSGTSGFSFNVAAGKFFRIDHIEGSIRVSSGTDLYADFAIRAVTTTGGATGTNVPVFYHRLNAVAESTNALAAGGGGAHFNVSGLSIDLPSSASYGVSIVSNSTASQECTFSFGGKEILL